jgi:SHS2 domain-containing protein
MFEILEHPADIGFRVRGRTLEELYAHAAVAMLSIADDPENVEPAEEHAISVESGDLESLMVDWLNEVLYWFDGRRIAFHDFRIVRMDEKSIDAVGRGQSRDAARHEAKLVVKAVTYHQLRVVRDGAGWMAEVYVDI